MINFRMDDDLKAAFDRYERALMDGDTATQAGSFWSAPDVVRVDGNGPVIGSQALAEFRARRPTPGPRRLRDLHVVHSPGETVVTVSVNERLGPDGEVTGLGTQTQVWARTEQGWRVIAACVSPITAPSPSSGGQAPASPGLDTPLGYLGKLAASIGCPSGSIAPGRTPNQGTGRPRPVS